MSSTVIFMQQTKHYMCKLIKKKKKKKKKMNIISMCKCFIMIKLNRTKEIQLHYENTPIQIYRNFPLQKLNIFR